MGCCVSKSAAPESLPSNNKNNNKGKERENEKVVELENNNKNNNKENNIIIEEPKKNIKDDNKKNKDEEKPISTDDVAIVVQKEHEPKPAPVEEEDPVAREEKLKKIFNQVDKDHSGFVDKEELKVILERLNLKVDDGSVQFMMARYDDDNNMRLNFEEFSEMILSIMDIKKQFTTADADKSGSVSRPEMQALLEKKQLTPEIAKDIFALFDQDQTQQVEFGEFVDLVFYVNELEYQYGVFKDRVGEDFAWLKPLLGDHNSAKVNEVGKQLLLLKKQNPYPPLSEFAKPIVKVAAEGVNNPMGRPKNAPRIKTQRARINPPPKKVMKIVPTETKAFVKPQGPYVDSSFSPENIGLPESARSKVKSWKRIHEINADAKLFVNGVEEGDVIQGSLGDCWFLGALAVVATSAENFIEHLFLQQEPDIGYYQCRFFKNGKWIVVEVDDLLPCDARGNLLFAKCKDTNEFWVPIVEKAYAKLHGSYEAIESGSIADALKDLTGEGIEVMHIDSEDMKRDKNLAWKILTHNASESFLMGCAIDNGASDKPETELTCGLLTGHAYSILNCQEVNGHKLVRMRNPWGQGEWNGAWADFSKEWTAELLRHVKYEFANDGTFYIAFEDFIQYYSRIYVLRLLTDGTGEVWSKAIFEGQWKGETAAGCANHTNWLNNPQYALHVPNDKTKFFINLSQPDLRYVLKKSPAAFNKEYDAIGLYILKTKDLRFRKILSEQEDRVATSAFTTVRDLSYECTLSAGDYVIVPCSFSPGAELQYGLSIYSDKPVQVSELTQTLPSKSLASEWKGASAGGCANNQATWLNNPQFLLTCSSGGKVEILVSQEQSKQDFEAVGIYVFSSDSPTRQTNAASLTLKPSRIINLPTVSETLNVEANKNYIIMPTTFEAGVERKFTVKVMSPEATFTTFSPL